MKSKKYLVAVFIVIALITLFIVKIRIKGDTIFIDNSVKQEYITEEKLEYQDHKGNIIKINIAKEALGKVTEDMIKQQIKDVVGPAEINIYEVVGP